VWKIRQAKKNSKYSGTLLNQHFEARVRACRVSAHNLRSGVGSRVMIMSTNERPGVERVGSNAKGVRLQSLGRAVEIRS